MKPTRATISCRDSILALVATLWGILNCCSVAAQTPLTLVSTGSIWRYLDNGTNQFTIWREPDFDDGDWRSGPAELGFGEMDEATHLQPGWRTYYFRHEFYVSNPNALTDLLLSVERDDGVVIYLNHWEVFRDNMPEGEIEFDTPANFPVEATGFIMTNISPVFLLAGRNVLAAEVHQAGFASSDISFDLQLDGMGGGLIVRLTSPTNGQVFRRGTNVELVATLQGQDPGTQVDFYAGPNRLGEDFDEPFSLVWSNVPLGEHFLRAVAAGQGGTVATSAPVRVTVVSNVLPQVTLNTSGDRFRPGANINLSAMAFDSDGFVARVEFFANGMKLGEAIASPYSFVWSNVVEGTYAVRAVATDNDGGQAISQSATVFVAENFPPSIRITQPQNGAIVSPGNIQVRVDASDFDGEVIQVEFFEDGIFIGVSTVPPFDFLWEDVPLGSYALSAVATDNDGATTQSDVIFFTVETPSDQLLRGPYVQLARPTSMTIHWRTGSAMDSRVRYGLQQGALDQVAQETGSKVEHSVTLSNLQPDTIYFYAVGSSSGDLAGGPGFYFRTAPGTPRPIRIWAIGDAGVGGGPQIAVRDAYATFASDIYTDVWLMLGDNAYGGGSDTEYQWAVFDMYSDMLRKSALWPTLGNHDLDVFGFRTWFDLPANGEAGGVPSGTEQYYSFNYANVHFICLDSYHSGRSTNTAMHVWLEQDLAAATNDWIIAYWHHPPYTKGTHNSDGEYDLVEMRENFLPLLESYGVDLVLCGHSHVYERSYVLNGHYGYSWDLQPGMILDHSSGRPNESGPYRKPAGGLGASNGTVYVVTGCSGQVGGGLLNHPVMYSSIGGVAGSLVLDVDGLQADVRFLAADGNILDYFTITKGDYPGAPRPLLKIERRTEGMLLSWPTSEPPYEVQRAGDVDPPNWLPVPENPIRIGRQNVLSLEPTASREFFRLRQRP